MGSNTIDSPVKVTSHQFTSKGCRCNTSGNEKRLETEVRVAAPSDAELRQVEGNVTRSVRSGRHMVRRTISRLGSERNWDAYKVRQFAKIFFLQDPLTHETVKTILQKLELTLGGLAGNITINLAAQVTNFNDAGVVDRGGTGFIHLRSGEFSRKYRNEIRGTGYSDSYENLKLEATSTMIHEATHLFANTIDYCYFEPWDEPKTPEAGYGDSPLACHGRPSIMSTKRRNR